MEIRDERSGDEAAIHAVHAAAFETPAEADLVDALRTEAEPFLSLVAERDGEIVGSVVLTPVTIEVDPAPGRALGLAPVAVRPDVQRQGIGGALVRAGLDRARSAGFEVVVVLGHSGYYPRFGFEPAGALGLTCDYPARPEAWMVQALIPGVLEGRRGRVVYHPAFAAL